MNNPVTKLPVKTEPKEMAATNVWQPFETLRREVDRVFEGFLPSRWPFQRTGFDFEPFATRDLGWVKLPSVDVVEKDSEYEVTAELPGIDEKNVEVTVAGDTLTIKGEKQDQKEEKKKDYHLSERHYGSFQRSLRVPNGIDADKVAATVKNGVLTVTLPKTAEAQKQQRKIPIKAA